jgi:hypothetical protein
VRAELQRHLPTLAASNRTLAGELAGAAPEAQAGAAPEASPPPAAVQLLDASRELQPIASAEELVACIAHVFEHDTELDEFERAVEALVRLAPLPPATVAALAPVVKRARKLRTPVAKELARLLLFVARGELSSVQAPVDHAGNESPVHAVLAARMDALAALAGQGCAVSPLSAPTHQRGFIAPAVLVERVRAHERAGACSAHEDQVLALLRLAPAATQEDRARARGLRDSPFARALRYALGDDLPPGSEVALFAAAARIRHPGRDDPAWPLGADALGPDAAVAARYAWAVTTRSWTVDGATYHHHDLAVQVMPERPGDCALLAVSRHPPPLPPGHNFYRGWSFGGIDEALVRHAATLLPSDLAAFFAEGARAIGGNLDWWEAQWQNKAYLEPLLDPTVEPGPMGTLLLCVALAGKEPGQTALAVDAFVAMSRQQRLDLPLLADTLRRLLATPLLKPPRLRKSLDAALRLAPALSRAVIELVLAALPVPPDEAPKDAAALLELLHELLVAAGRCLPEDRRAGIAAMALGGKGRSLQKALLALGAAPV